MNLLGVGISNVPERRMRVVLSFTKRFSLGP
jgi:hypothetical protein